MISEPFKSHTNKRRTYLWHHNVFLIKSTAAIDQSINKPTISTSFRSHVFPIRPHFLTLINSSHLSRWPSALNTYSKDLTFFHVSLPSLMRERRQLYCVKVSHRRQLKTKNWKQSGGEKARIPFSKQVLTFLLLLLDSSPVIFVKAVHLLCERRTGAKNNKLNNKTFQCVIKFFFVWFFLLCFRSPRLKGRRLPSLVSNLFTLFVIS